MGQWATRSRRGGGQGSSTILIAMTDAIVTGTFDIEVAYTADVVAATLNPADFSLTGSAANVANISQISSTLLLFEWDDDITAASQITYSGSTPNILTPQTIAVV